MHRNFSDSSKWVLFTGVCLLLAMAGCGSGSQSLSSQKHHIKTVFVIVMENHNWTGDGAASIKDNPRAPYINGTLVPMSSYATNYFNPPHIHPSLPNYLWLEAGTNFGILDDGTPFVHHQSTHQHLVALLQAQGISWRDYDERSTGKNCPLTFWHNPFVFFDDVTDTNNPASPGCIAHIRPFTELSRDLQNNTVTSYNFIVPGGCNSMHDEEEGCGSEDPIAHGDLWLSTTVSAILNSTAYKQGGVLFLLWDEAAKGDGPIPALVLSPFAKGQGYNNNMLYTHGSILRTVEEIFGVTPLLNDAAVETDLSDMFKVFP